MTCSLWWRWGDSTSGPPPGRLPSGGYVGALTCGSLVPVVTGGDRCRLLSAIPSCTQRVPVAYSAVLKLSESV
jgi:hypothetical protein